MKKSITFNSANPYTKCVVCEKLGRRCDGPNFLAMTPEQWLEWIQLRKEHLRWTNAEIAEAADISKTTIDRIFAGHGGDLRTSTLEAITKVLVNGSWGQFPCADPGGEEVIAHLQTIAEQKQKIEELQAEIIAAHAERRSQEVHVSEDQQKKIDYLKQLSEERKHRIMFCEEAMQRNEKTISSYRKIIALLGVVCLVILVALLIDLASGNIGWLRYR